ncbi:hypothetical protein EDD11_007949 [Mortierella claussenii]|nr:hypothetical protein EDD11_007949 [Mortierella claussenii]
MAATSISTYSHSTLTSTPMLYFPNTAKKQPSTSISPVSVTPIAEAPSLNATGVHSSAPVSTSIPASNEGGICATVSVVGPTVNSGSAPSSSNSASAVVSPAQKSIVQQRRQPLGPPLRLVLQHRRHQYQHRSSYGTGHPLLQQIQTHIRSNSQNYYSHLLSPSHKKTQSIQLAGKLEDALSNQLVQSPLQGTLDRTATSPNVKTLEEESSMENVEQDGACCPDYVYTAPCEHHPSKGQTEYLVNDMFPKLEHDLSTIEFGIRIADFMPLAFKTVPVAGLAEKELELLHGLGSLPNVIQLQDSFVNDHGNTVLVLPMLKKFDCHAVNKSICSVRKTIKQVLTGLAAVHAKNIVHLDINPSNLMVTHTKRDVVIIDFGLSMTVERPYDNDTLSSSSDPIPVCGTTGYIAPEIINPQFYNHGQYDPTVADLYSLGIVLGEMLEPYIPDCDLHYFGSKYLSLENTNQTVHLLKDFMSQRSLYPPVLIQAADLLKNMLEENPKDRKSARQLLDSHPFLDINLCAGSSPTMATVDGDPNMKLDLCDWLYRVQEIKYQKYLCEEQNGCEVYRYR